MGCGCSKSVEGSVSDPLQSVVVSSVNLESLRELSEAREDPAVANLKTAHLAAAREKKKKER